MEFIKQMEYRDEVNLLMKEIENGNIKMEKERIPVGYKPICIVEDRLYLSVQANWGAYCTPRKTTLDLNEYSEMEMAFVTAEGLVSLEMVYPYFSKLDEIQEYFDGDQIYSYVPVELIEDVYQELISDRALSIIKLLDKF